MLFGCFAPLNLYISLIYASGWNSVSIGLISDCLKAALVCSRSGQAIIAEDQPRKVPRRVFMEKRTPHHSYIYGQLLAMLYTKERCINRSC